MMHSRCAWPGPDDARDRPSHSSRDSFALVGSFETAMMPRELALSKELRVIEARAGKPLSACVWGWPMWSPRVRFGDVEIGALEFSSGDK